MNDLVIKARDAASNAEDTMNHLVVATAKILLQIAEDNKRIDRNSVFLDNLRTLSIKRDFLDVALANYEYCDFNGSDDLKDRVVEATEGVVKAEADVLESIREIAELSEAIREIPELIEYIRDSQKQAEILTLSNNAEVI